LWDGHPARPDIITPFPLEEYRLNEPRRSEEREGRRRRKKEEGRRWLILSWEGSSRLFMPALQQILGYFLFGNLLRLCWVARSLNPAYNFP